MYAEKKRFMLACFSRSSFDPLTVPLTSVPVRFQTFRPDSTGRFWIFHLFCQICPFASLDGLLLLHVYISGSCFFHVKFLCLRLADAAAHFWRNSSRVVDIVSVSLVPFSPVIEKACPLPFFYPSFLYFVLWLCGGVSRWKYILWKFLGCAYIRKKMFYIPLFLKKFEMEKINEETVSYLVNS